jgi:hypothetical protein
MEELYKQLILSWRRTFEALTLEEKASISNLDNLRTPCQLEVILLQNEQLGITEQLWIITHFTNEPDLSINVHKPITSVNATKALPEIIKSHRFQMPLPENTRFLGAKTYSDLIEGHLLTLVESFRDSAVRNLWSGQLPMQGVHRKSFLSEEAFIWHFRGIVDAKAIEDLVTDIMKHAKEDARKRKEQPPTATKAPKRDEIKARGTYIYPHVWVGSRPLYSFEDELNDRIYARQRYRIGFDETVVFDRLESFYAVTTRDGLIAVTLEDNAAALRILNSFMSLLTLRGTPALAVRQNELGELTLDPSTGKVIGSHMAIILPRMLPRDPSFVRPRWQEERMPVLQLNLVKEIWKDVATILDDHVTSDLLQIFGEVYTHFQRAEYPQAILLAWTLIERWYVSIRERAIGLEKLTKIRRSYHVADMLHLLETEALIDRDTASNMYQLWQLRTEVVHTFKHVTKEEAQIALAIVANVLQGIKG